MTPEDWEREWRGRIDGMMAAFNSAVTTLTSKFDQLSGRIENHEYRIVRIEQSPAGVRSWLTFALAALTGLATIGGCLSMIVGAIVAFVSVLIGVGTLILGLIGVLH